MHQEETPQLPDYIQTLKRRLNSIQREQNGSYSLRAFARDLGLSPSTLTRCLRGERRIPLRHLQKILDVLQLSPQAEMQFVESWIKKSGPEYPIREDYLNRQMVDEGHYEVIAQWEHFAVLALMDTSNFMATPSNIAERFGFPLLRAEVVLENLEKAGLVKKNEQGKYQKTCSQLKTSDGISSKALKASHKDILQLAIDKIDKLPVEHRDFTSFTFEGNLKNLPEVRQAIREFEEKMATLMQKDTTSNEVFTLNIQLFPLTVIKGKKS